MKYIKFALMNLIELVDSLCNIGFFLFAVIWLISLIGGFELKDSIYDFGIVSFFGIVLIPNKEFLNESDEK